MFRFLCFLLLAAVTVGAQQPPIYASDSPIDGFGPQLQRSRNFIVVLHSPFLIYPPASDPNQTMPAAPADPLPPQFSTRRPGQHRRGTPVRFTPTIQRVYLQERLGALLDETRHLGHAYSIEEFVGFSASFTSGELSHLLRGDDENTISFVEEDRVVHLHDEVVEITAAARSWGQDRVDQRTLPLSATYDLPRINGTAYSGSGVTVFVIDTGLAAHQECPAPRCRQVANFAGDGIARDCQGHGSHVAGTVAGGTTGIAPGAQVAAVKVLNCEGSGSWSSILAGMNYAASNKPPGAAVASMSLGGPYSQSINTATNNLAKVMVTMVAAGNENQDARNTSPASATSANVLTVASTTSSDTRSSFSNWGPAVDVLAPGSAIRSANPCASGSSCSCSTCYSSWSGTSMATPHVAGAAAVFLQWKPNWTASQIASYLRCAATPNRISGLPSQTGTCLPPALVFFF